MYADLLAVLVLLLCAPVICGVIGAVLGAFFRQDEEENVSVYFKMGICIGAFIAAVFGVIVALRLLL